MHALETIVRGVDTLNTWVGRIIAWLCLGTVVVCFATVYTRYALDTNFTWLQEVYVWQHAAAIVLGAGYTMLVGGFVRVDIFYGKMTPRGRAKVDLAGTLLLMFPFLAALAFAFWGLFLNSWNADEGSQNPGGLPNWWLLKIALLTFLALVFLQGVAAIARAILVLRGREEFATVSSH